MLSIRKQCEFIQKFATQSTYKGNFGIKRGRNRRDEETVKTSFRHWILEPTRIIHLCLFFGKSFSNAKRLLLFKFGRFFNTKYNIKYVFNTKFRANRSLEPYSPCMYKV